MPDVEGLLRGGGNVRQVEGPGALKQPQVLEEGGGCALAQALRHDPGHVFWMYIRDAIPATE